MAVTAKDVAIQAGVSVSTVSRALTRPDLVSEETRSRIETVARQLNYRPNSMARCLSTGKTYHVGLVLPDLENPFFSSVAKGIQSHARHLGYSVFIADSDEDATVEPDLVHQLAPQVDGVIVCSPRSDPEEIQSWAEETPLVLISRAVESVSSVILDNVDGIQQAVRHLWALGHTHIAYTGGPRASWSDQVRREAFLDIMGSIDGMVPIDIGNFQPFHHGGLVAADLALASGATAIIGYNDLIAMGLIERLHARGVRVPQDISIVGIDGIPLASLVSPGLTTVAGPLHLLGKSGMDLLLADSSEPVSKLLPVELIVRASSGEAPHELSPIQVRTQRANRPSGTSGPSQ